MSAEILAPGAVFARRFRIDGELGRGGMGIVYKAFDTLADREVALKIIAEKLASDPEYVERFQREYKAVAKLRHEGIVILYDANVSDGGQHYLVMELIHGMTLRVALKHAAGGRVPLLQAAYIALRIADAVQSAHQKNLCHRDIKPENIMLGDEAHGGKGRVWLVDFGLAKMHGGAALTEEQRPLGTLRYVPPEVAMGSTHPDHRGDLYQIGCVFFEMCTGKSPYRVLDDPAATPAHILTAHIVGKPRALGELLENVPPRAEAIVRRLLAKDPAGRYQAARELGDDLGELIREIAPSPRHWMVLSTARGRTEPSGQWPTMMRGGTEQLGAPAPPAKRVPEWIQQAHGMPPPAPVSPSPRASSPGAAAAQAPPLRGGTLPLSGNGAPPVERAAPPAPSERAGAAKSAPASNPAAVPTPPASAVTVRVVILSRRAQRRAAAVGVGFLTALAATTALHFRPQASSPGATVQSAAPMRQSAEADSSNLPVGSATATGGPAASASAGATIPASSSAASSAPPASGAATSSPGAAAAQASSALAPGTASSTLPAAPPPPAKPKSKGPSTAPKKPSPLDRDNPF